jgi:hypothetical protein
LISSRSVTPAWTHSALPTVYTGANGNGCGPAAIESKNFFSQENQAVFKKLSAQAHPKHRAARIDLGDVYPSAQVWEEAR